jgi:hypothetical protein
VEALQATGQGAAAAAVTLQYLRDVDGAVAGLCGAREWREASRVAHHAGRADLVDTVVAPHAAGAAQGMLAGEGAGGRPAGWGLPACDGAQSAGGCVRGWVLQGKGA